MTVGLWFGYGLALGGPTAAVLLHFALLPTVATATYALARRVAPRAAPWLAVALVVTVPTVIWEASTAYIDLAMMLFLTLALYALLRYLEAHRSQWLVLAALNLGFALASKHLALLAALLLGAGLFLALLRQGAGPRKAFGAFSVLAGISFLLVLPWYVRSYLATGDPVFQVLYPLLGAPPDRWDAMTEAGARRFLNHFGRPRTLPNLLTLPWDMTMHAANYGGTLGPLYLLFLPLLALRRLRGALLWIAVGAAAFVLLWASPVSSFQVRHLLPIVPLLAVLAAVAFARTAALARSVGGRHAPALLAVCTAALMVLNVPPFTILHQGDMDGWRGWFTSVLHKLPLGVVIGGEDEATYLARQIRSYVVWRFADQTLPSDARVLTWSSGEDLYTRLDRLWANSALGNDAAWAPAGKEEEAFALLHDLGITHLIVDIRPEDSPDPWDAYALTSPTVRHTWYEELYADDGYVLYRIRWEMLRPDN
jgi:4-amino-4-deoxy-L-arabinose transferase-like glycosyltransferase